MSKITEINKINKKCTKVHNTNLHSTKLVKVRTIQPCQIKYLGSDQNKDSVVCTVGLN